MRLRTIRTQQPPGDARLSGIALAHGAVAAQFAPGVRVNHALESAGTLTEAYGPGGRGLYLAGSGTAEIVALPRSIADTWTLIALVDWAALGTLTSPLDCDSTLSGFTRVFQFRKTAANKMEVIRFNTGGSPFTVTTTGAAVTGKPQFIAMRSAGLSFSVTLGTETVSGTMTGTARSLGAKMLVGAGGAGGGGRATAAHNGRIYGWVLFDKFLDASDLMDYAANFWIAADAQRTPVFYSLGGGTIYDESLSESVSASDSLSAAAAFGGALAEAASAADALAAVAALAGDLSEAASASDVVSAAAAYADALSEAASASDAVSATAQMAGALSESVSASDAVSSTAQMEGALSESVSAADSIDGSIGAATYAAELVESVSASDSLTAAVVYASAIVEAVTAQDAVTASAVLGAVLDEVASASDSVGAALVLAAAISEAVSAADGWSDELAQVYSEAIDEAVSASDAWSASIGGDTPRAPSARIIAAAATLREIVAPAARRRIH